MEAMRLRAGPFQQRCNSTAFCSRQSGQLHWVGPGPPGLGTPVIQGRCQAGDVDPALLLQVADLQGGAVQVWRPLLLLLLPQLPLSQADSAVSCKQGVHNPDNAGQA